MSTPARGNVLIPVLLFVSGFCGISYEILYTKLLSNLLGNQFIIVAATLLTFLLGIGLGTLFAHRFVRHLWIIEAGIGVYAAVFVALYGQIEAFLYLHAPALGNSLVGCAVVSTILLAVPAFLVGCSVPLFAAYLSSTRTKTVFSLTYGIYNVGAAITALAMEFVLFRLVGLRVSTLLLAGLNVVVALNLLVLVRTALVIPAPRIDHLRFARRDVVALILASVASAIFQLSMIKVAEFIFGPFNETFALVLATVLLGLAVGSFAVAYLGLTFRGSLLAAAAGIALLLAGLWPATVTYASLYAAAAERSFYLVALKFGLVVVLMGLPAVGFGATIPALLRTHRDIARESGLLLFFASMGNVLGFVLMAFVLHRALDYGPLLVVVAFVVVAALATHAGPRKATVFGVGLLVLAVAAQQRLWKESYLYFGHNSFKSLAKVSAAKKLRKATERHKGYHDVFAITTIYGEPHFFINGYISIKLTTPNEKIVGAISAMLSPRTDEALVLGVGSGATAGTVGLVFDHTDAVEINKVVLDNLSGMKEYSFDIENQSNVTLHHDDGAHFLRTTPRTYSLILNTVTSPLYFSSSKLYTTDFLDDVRDRLKPDGVYTTWVDSNIGDRGVDIILQTLDEAFEECWMSYLSSSYYLLTCSDSPIGLRQNGAVTANARLRENLMRKHRLPLDLLRYSVISTDAAELGSDTDVPLNTMDFPVLEYEMTRVAGSDEFEDLPRRLAERMDLRTVQRRLGSDTPWELSEFLLWADRRLPRDDALTRAIRAAVPRGQAPSGVEASPPDPSAGM